MRINVMNHVMVLLYDITCFDDDPGLFLFPHFLTDCIALFLFLKRINISWFSYKQT